MYKIVNKWIPKNSHILDLGCGDGSMLFELKKELNINGLGVDISENNIQPVSYTHLPLPTKRIV